MGHAAAALAAGRGWSAGLGMIHRETLASLPTPSVQLSQNSAALAACSMIALQEQETRQSGKRTLWRGEMPRE